MVKLYVICLDAFPEIKELKMLASNVSLTKSTLVCAGAFTCSTFTSILSGKLGSEIIPGGIGYNTLYKPEFFTWRKNSLTERLLDTHKNVWVHNHVPWFSVVIGGKALTKDESEHHYRDHKVNVSSAYTNYPFGVVRQGPGVLYSCTNPDLSLNTFLKWNFPDERAKFYANERTYIKWLQTPSRFDGVFFTDLCHWHESIYYPKGQIVSNHGIDKQTALHNTIEWLKGWNFDEPDAVFLIFADHSHRVEPYLDPSSYTTWCYYRDNVRNKKLNPVISSCDLYHLVEDLYHLPTNSSTGTSGKWSRSPFTDYDPLRVYAIEDGRADAKLKDVATAFSRCTLVGNLILSVTKLIDSTLYPAGNYIIIASLDNLNTYTVYHHDEYFSIECSGPIDERKKVTKKIFELTPVLKAKADMLLLLIRGY